jgi:hypothetical protein
MANALGEKPVVGTVVRTFWAIAVDANCNQALNKQEQKRMHRFCMGFYSLKQDKQHWGKTVLSASGGRKLPNN